MKSHGLFNNTEEPDYIVDRIAKLPWLIRLIAQAIIIVGSLSFLLFLGELL